LGSIRKQTIISSALVYLGFLIGFINNYLYTRSGSFSSEQFGLTRIFFDFAQNMGAFGALGVVPVIYKFYPYYKDNLEEKKIDLMTWALVTAFIGFCLVIFLGWYVEPFFIRKYTRTSPLVVSYYFWMIPFAIGLLFFSLIESFCWALHKSIFSSFLKETLLRAVTTILILLFYFKVVTFRVFIELFAFQYLLIFLVLFVYLKRIGKLHFPRRISRVTKKFWKKMLGMQLLTFGGYSITSVAATVDVFIIAGVQDLRAVGIFVFAQNLANLIQVPARSIQGVSAGVLSQAWKDKNYSEINRVYKRSCINLLLMSLFICGNIMLNIKAGIYALDIQRQYLEGLGVLLVLSCVRIVDAGTGLNASVINTSTFWRFDFYSGVVLLCFRLPLTYFLIKKYGIIGSAYAELMAYTVYDLIRCEFLRRKFKMQPFSMKNLYSLLLAGAAFSLSYFLMQDIPGWPGILLRGALFSTIMIAGVFYFKLTPDAGQLYEVFLIRVDRLRKRIKPR
jgi:O-antigen/teichoic acid export membrane protein